MGIHSVGRLAGWPAQDREGVEMANSNWKPSDYVRSGWTQGARARDIHGMTVLAVSPDAVSWCLTGALSASDLVTERDLFRMRRECRGLVGDGLTDWNDDPGRTQAEVVELLERVEALVLGTKEGA